MKTLTFKGIITTALMAASGGNVDSDNTKYSMIVVSNAADPLVPIIGFPIKKGAVKRITYVSSAAEVRKQWLIGGEETEVIVASRKYTIGIDHYDAKVNSERRGTKTLYSYTAPAVLSGTAATDRAAVYTALAGKINARYDNFAEAKLVYQAAYTGGDVHLPVIGETFTETTGGETAIIVGYTITSGTIAGHDAAGMLYLHTPSATFEGGAGTATSTFACSLAAQSAWVAAQAICIVDDAGYFTTPAEYRPGASIVTLESGFTVATADAIIDRTYSQGIGTEMLLHTPTFSKSAQDVLSGDIEYTFNTPPVSGQTYELAIIDIEHSPETEAGFGSAPVQQVQIHLYMDESDGTNLTNIKSALNALVGL